MSPETTLYLAVCTALLAFLNIVLTIGLGVFNYRQTRLRDAQGHQLATDKMPEAFRSHLYTERLGLVRQLSTLSYNVLRSCNVYVEALPHNQGFIPIYDRHGEEKVTVEEQEEELRNARASAGEHLAELWRAHVLAHAILDPDAVVALVDFRRRATKVVLRRTEDRARDALEELDEAFDTLATTLRSGTCAEALSAQTRKLIGTDVTGKDALPKRTDSGDSRDPVPDGSAT